MSSGSSTASPVASSYPVVVNYMSFAVLTAFAYDWILSLADDIHIAKKCGLTLSTLAYFVSRIGMLTVCIMAAIFPIGSIAHCETMLRLNELADIVATSATAFLFLTRVRAVYQKSKAITAFFGCFWLGIVGTSTLQLISSRGSNIGTTKRCAAGEVKSETMAFLWAKAAYDTSIFFAISFRVASQSSVGGRPNRSVIAVLRGKGLSRISRDLIHSGQLYYFVTIGMTLFAALMTIAPGVQPIYRAYFTEPALALESSMACRVFRAIILGSMKEPYYAGVSIALTTFMPLDSHDY